MILAVHIIIAMISLTVTTCVVVRPMRALLRASYALGALTIGTGTYVAWSSHAQMLQACTTGLFYISIVSLGIFVAQRRLAGERVKVKK